MVRDGVWGRDGTGLRLGGGPADHGKRSPSGVRFMSRDTRRKEFEETTACRATWAAARCFVSDPPKLHLYAHTYTHTHANQGCFIKRKTRRRLTSIWCSQNVTLKYITNPQLLQSINISIYTRKVSVFGTSTCRPHTDTLFWIPRVQMLRLLRCHILFWSVFINIKSNTLKWFVGSIYVKLAFSARAKCYSNV